MYANTMLQPQTVRALSAVWKWRPLEVTVPAAPGASSPGEVEPQLELAGGQHYFTEWLNLNYPTVIEEEGTEIDDGVSRLSVKLSAGTADLALSAGFIDLHLIGVPGRRRSAGIAAADPSQGVYLPGMPCPAFITDGNGIYHYLRNTANVAARVAFLWGGWDIPASRVKGAQEFWDIVTRCQGTLSAFTR